MNGDMDQVGNGGANEVVLVFGPVAAVEQVVGRLTACGVLAVPAPVLPDAGNPVRGSCVLRMTTPGGGRTPDRGPGNGWRKTTAGLLQSLATVLRRPDRDTARRPEGSQHGRPGRHRARTGS
ncbi:hypothetical protein [Streptodolium elevatio]|uniref:Uncharacterized protein n=1 Tax=Streptodolium elevatio TaxID=3157996 RepID=A0ABV3DW45_9ACTN